MIRVRVTPIVLVHEDSKIECTLDTQDDHVHGCDGNNPCWLCPGCQRYVPWEYGVAGSDGLNDYCDDCWFVLYEDEDYEEVA